MFALRVRPAWRVFLITALCAFTAATYPPRLGAQGQGPATAPLLQASDLVYQGAFRLPMGTFGGSSFDYGGTALAFNPASSSLFMAGHPWQQQVAEVSIPTPAVGALSSLPTASVLQPFADLTEGNMKAVGFNPSGDTPVVGGLLPYGNRLYQSVYLYYDGAGTQVRSHFVSGLNLSALGDVSGPFQIGDATTVPNLPAAGFLDGYMGVVPQAWQGALGGPVLTGNCCTPIISRTSYGPAAFAIDPSALGVVNPLPAVPLVYYPSQHPTLGDWDSSGALFNGVSQVTGVVFPENTRSILFFGRVGLGVFCYGQGTNTQALGGTLIPGTTDQYYCYDPADGSKGTHGFPYAYAVWAYDALDFVAVKNGARQPWEVQPYAAWTFDLPFASSNAAIQGAAYDPASGRIFLTQYQGDGSMPVVHVLSLGAGSPPPGSPADVPPTVSLTSPANSTIVAAGSSVSIAASASDSDGSVASVSFYANGTLIGSSTAAPYAMTWSNPAAGTYRLSAVAADNEGQTTSSSVVTITVQAATPRRPPKATLLTPRNGSTFTAGTTIHLSAAASDSDGTVTTVAFFANGTHVGTAFHSPWASDWVPATAGTYRITAVATDNDGQTGSSATATISVRSCGRRC